MCKQAPHVILKEDLAKLSMRSNILTGFKVGKDLHPPSLLKHNMISYSKLDMVCVHCMGYPDRLSSESDKPLVVWMPLVCPRSSSTQRLKEMFPPLSTVLPCVGASGTALYHLLPDALLT